MVMVLESPIYQICKCSNMHILSIDNSSRKLDKLSNTQDQFHRHQLTITIDHLYSVSPSNPDNKKAQLKC